MTKFKLIRHRDLSRAHFEQHPAWADYSEPADIEEVVRWGVERAVIVEQLERLLSSEEDLLFPALRTNPLPSFRSLYLKADLIAADGSRLTGYVINEHPHCVVVFHGDEGFSFNVHLPGMACEELARLRRASQLSLAPFFPLRYSTPFWHDDGERIEGAVDYDRDA